MTIAEHLNGLPEEEARRQLLRCCSSPPWVDAMLAARPFPDDDSLQATARSIWEGLSPQRWREAFEAHPRIGDRGHREEWAKGEQSGMMTATERTAHAIYDGNRRYEERFGHIYLVCATGKTAEEMLEDMLNRILNDPDTEIRVAAQEQAAITELRLRKLVEP